METNTHSGTWRIANYQDMVYTADERQLTAKATILQIVIPSELFFSSHQLVGKSLSQLVLPGWCVRGGGLNPLLNFFSHSENRALIIKKKSRNMASLQERRSVCLHRTMGGTYKYKKTTYFTQ